MARTRPELHERDTVLCRPPPSSSSPPMAFEIDKNQEETQADDGQWTKIKPREVARCGRRISVFFLSAVCDYERTDTKGVALGRITDDKIVTIGKLLIF